MSLLAAASLGVGSVATVHAEIRGEAAASAGDMRLIVQTYDASAGAIPERARPLGSVQRSITAEELRAGVSVSLVQLGAGAPDGAPLVVAWVEHGKPDLELDARRARPGSDSLVGLARGDQVRIQLAKLPA